MLDEKELIIQIENDQENVKTDKMDMSVGEIVSLYENEELLINPSYQRLYNWDDERKTNFIESIILGIPIPSIFVVEDENGIWELVDGLQRVTTLVTFLENTSKKIVYDIRTSLI